MVLITMKIRLNIINPFFFEINENVVATTHGIKVKKNEIANIEK